MALTVTEQYGTHTTSAVANLTVPAFTPAAGDVIVVATTYYQSSMAVGNFSDGTNTYHLDDTGSSQYNGTGQMGNAYAENVPASSTTVVITPNSSDYLALDVSTISGAATSGSRDSGNGSSTSGGASTTPSVSFSTTDSNTVIVAIITPSSNVGDYSITPGSGYNQLSESEDQNFLAYNADYQVFSSSGSKTVDWTLGNTPGGTGISATAFKQAGAAVVSAPYVPKLLSLRVG